MNVIALDIGGTKIETAVFDREFNLLQSWRVATPTDSYETFLNVIQRQVQQAETMTGVKCPVGVGMPGLINQKGQVLSANVPCATNKYIADDLRFRLKRPVAIENDTRCFALSEANKGSGEGYSRVFGAIIGTGAAGGLCVDGALQDTQLGMAGEYGHIPLSATLQQKYALPILTCGCGLVGCVESYIAGPGIEMLYHHFVGTAYTARYFAEQLRKKDPIALNILECYLDILGETFATLCKLVEPDVLVLGGGVSLIEPILEGLPEAIEAHLFGGFSAPVVMPAKFGDSSGVRGAAIIGAEANG